MKKTATKTELVKASCRNVPISTKHSVELCNWLRYKTTKQAKDWLEEVAVKKRAVPFKRFNRDVGHKPGMAAGRYPIKAAKELLQLVQSVEANAQFKGLSAGQLKIVKLLANRAPIPMTGGRRNRQTKRTHIEIVVKESQKVEKITNKKKDKKKEDKKFTERNEEEIKKESVTKERSKEKERGEKTIKEEVAAEVAAETHVEEPVTQAEKVAESEEKATEKEPEEEKSFETKGSEASGAQEGQSPSVQKGGTSFLAPKAEPLSEPKEEDKVEAVAEEKVDEKTATEEKKAEEVQSP